MSIINGYEIEDPAGFRPLREVVLAQEMVNGYGQTIGDFVRERYVLAYRWDILEPAELSALFDATGPQPPYTLEVTHPTVDGGTYTGVFRVYSPVCAQKLVRDGARILWSDVTLDLREV